MNLSIDNLRLVVIGLVLGLTQVAYIIPAGGVLSMVMIVLVYLYLIGTFSKLNIFQAHDIIIIVVIVAMAIMGALLLVFGEDGEFQSRNLFLWAFIQLAAVSCFLTVSKNQNNLKRLVKIIIALLFIEVFIIFDQFLMMSFGIGFSKISEYNESLAMVTGSMTNPNDSAAYIGLMLLVLTAFYSANGENNKSIILLVFVFPAVFLTLSRTILAFWLLNIMAVSFCSRRPTWQLTKILISIISGLIFAINNFDDLSGIDSAIIFRSMDRLMSFSDFGGDNSIDFRVISHVRLFEKFGSLGVGTFSDLNYLRFFDYADPWLMKINPHSFLVEYSFLFGYFGFFIISMLFIILLKGVISNPMLPISFKVVTVFAIFFIQAVPSSLLSLSFYIIPFLIISKIRRVEECIVSRK